MFIGISYPGFYLDPIFYDTFLRRLSSSEFLFMWELIFFLCLQNDRGDFILKDWDCFEVKILQGLFCFFLYEWKVVNVDVK